MTAKFIPDFLTRANEQRGWDGTPAVQAKRQKDLALLEELMAVTRPLTQMGDGQHVAPRAKVVR